MDEAPPEDSAQRGLTEVRIGQAPTQQVSLEDVIRLAGPIAEAYFDRQAEAHKREVAYDTRVLEHENSWRQSLLRAATVVTVGLFTLAGILFYKGRDDAALDLIKLVVALAGAGLGGYGIARAKQQRESEE